ncbi:hypothetical protein ACFLU6_04225, partial [Acidobacteriota bacterium]
FGDKLNLEPGALTYGDVRPHLEKRGAPPELLDRIRSFFEEFEALHYAGDEGKGSDLSSFVDRARRLAREMEPYLK